ncbi:radical SAM protein [Halobacteriovorax sp. HLS]|uniref:radical SAM protein n=1 Tax=Halobacteriovorax sp. HLS TaxID=2234000 RepID=UPI0013E2F771|nr:radical SAM protein [Halobacteriovorax sp. HLS]
MNELNIILGHKCNYTCTHCVNSSGPDQVSSKLSDDEISNITTQIKEHAPKLVLFTGGEPTLYLKDMNQFIREHPNKLEAKFGITTNGWFGSSIEQTRILLDKVDRLDFVQVSFDAFHGTKTEYSYIKNIRDYCESKGMSFNISMAIAEPKDLLMAQELIKDLGVKVIFQKVSKVGRAQENNITYKYFKFEESVLDEKCPNVDSFTYIPAKGYSNCCGNLVYNDVTQDICNTEFDDYISSDIFKTLRNKTFKEMLADKEIDTAQIPVDCSSACNLCEFIFKRSS